jgi:hypothetical protein
MLLYGDETDVRVSCPDQGDGGALALVHHNYVGEDVWILSDSVDIWRSAEDYGEGP